MGPLWGEVLKVRSKLEEKYQGRYFDGYVHVVGSVPLRIVMILEPVLLVLQKLLKEDRRRPMFIDSTGKTVLHIQCIVQSLLL